MLFSLRVDVHTISFILCGKYSKQPQKENGTTLPKCGPKGIVR